MPAYYFRKTFVVNSTNLEELLLAATCTDVSVSAIYPLRLFLNGTEVNTFIDTVTMQGNETRYFDLTPFSSLIRSGTNTIAIQIGNSWSDYDDVAFDVCLKSINYQPLVPRLFIQESGNTFPHIFVEASARSIWQLQFCDSLSTANWQVMQTFTNVTGNTLEFQDMDQTSRPPASGGKRFYRLLPY